MPTAPIWSNMLLGKNLFFKINTFLLMMFNIGNLNRHRRVAVKAFENFCVAQLEERTTAISERRMGILKRTQLGKGNILP